MLLLNQSILVKFGDTSSVYVDGSLAGTFLPSASLKIASSARSQVVLFTHNIPLYYTCYARRGNTHDVGGARSLDRIEVVPHAIPVSGALPIII